MMKKQFKIYFVVVACGLLFASTLFSQNQMLALQISKINIAKTEQFVSAHKKSIEILKKESKTPVYYGASMTNENKLVIVVPIKSFADLDKISADLSANMQLIGNELNQKVEDAVESQETGVVMLRRDLSLLPAKRTDLADKNYLRWTHYYYQPKDRGKVVALAEKMKAYWEKQADQVPYFVYQPIYGNELYRMVIMHQVKDLAAIAEFDSSVSAHMKNPEFVALNKELASIVTDVRTIYGWSRPDLSMQPE